MQDPGAPYTDVASALEAAAESLQRQLPCSVPARELATKIRAQAAAARDQAHRVRMHRLRKLHGGRWP